MIKEKGDVRDRWNLLQTKFKRTQREELLASGIGCELSEKDALIEEVCQKKDSSFAKEKKKSDDKEKAEEIRKKAMERMAFKKNQVNQLEAALKRAGEAAEAMLLNSRKKKLKVSILFAGRSWSCKKGAGGEIQTTRSTAWTVTEVSRTASVYFTGVDDHDAKSG